MASTSERIWSALDAMPVRSGVRAAWREVVGDEGFRLLAPFLTAGATLAVTYPCDEPGDDGCPRGVVVHGPGDIEAVCRRRPRSCETLRLEREDVVIWRFDPVRLARAVRDVLALGGDGPSSVEGLPRAVALGTYRPLAGVEARAYLVLPEDPDDCAAIIERLVAREAAAFLLVLLTTGRLSAASSERIRARGAATLALANFAVIEGEKGLRADPSADEVLAAFRRELCDTAARDAGADMAFFPTPADSAWSDVVIRFLDGHSVSVRVGSARGVFNYTQMGMANRKNSRPTKQWDLLRAFAEESGVLSWKSRYASRDLQKRREVLAQRLRAFFRIDGDPIEFAAGESGWRLRFQLVGEN